MKDYINQQKKGYLNRLKHIQEKLFDYQMQLEELEDDLDNEGRETKDDDYDEAIQKLNENRYKDKVTINLNTKLGSTLEDVDFRYMGVINQYLPADYENGAENTVKELPVMSIKEDSKGNKSLTFGRLSDFWFMDD